MVYEHVVDGNKRSEIRKVNEAHLAGFGKWLKGKGLSQKTIDSHIANVGFYINDYLCYYGISDASRGCHEVNGFLGDWFIRKAMWSSCAHIKSNAAGIKKFYAYLLEEKIIEQEDFDILCETIKEFMPEWLDEMRRYDEAIFGDSY
jgi:site-specific recombinase XerD